MSGEQLAFPWDATRFQIPPKRQAAEYPNQFSLAPEELSSEGGGFLYESCTPVFLGRRGYGPLRMAWDTNILIDYGKYGELMWESDDFDPPISETTYLDELIALNEIMHLWMIRDIRIRMPEAQLFDAGRRRKRGLDLKTLELRLHQLTEFHAALACISLDTNIDNSVPPLAPLDDDWTNDDWDRALVEHAVATGCHVFLTRDQRLHRHVPQTSETFLAIMSPADLLLYLAESGELSLAQVGRHIAPDSHKWVHILVRQPPFAT